MIYRKTKQVRVNLGNYEHAVVEVTLEASDTELGPGLEPESYIDSKLNMWLAEDIAKLSKVTANEDSVSEIWSQNGT